MQKIVINKCYRGFGLSDEAINKYMKLKGIDKPSDFWEGRIFRDDLILIQVVEEFGNSANGSFAELKVVEIPDGVEWVVEEYDGMEWVAEKHKTWG